MEQLESLLQRIEVLLLIGTKNVLTSTEVATMLGVTQDHIRHLTSKREIPHYKKGHRAYYKKQEIEEWLLNRRVPTCDENRMHAATHVAINPRM